MYSPYYQRLACTLEYLIEGILPDDHEEAYRLKRLVTHYFMEGGILFRKGFNGEPLRCLGTPEAQSVMQEVHKSVGTIKVKGDFSSSCSILGIFGPL